MLFRVIAALVCNLILALGALKKRAVSKDGALAGFGVGCISFVAGGPLFWIILGSFFVSSSLLSPIGRRRKQALKKLHAKGSRRDALQVAANAGVGTAAALLYLWRPEPALLAAFAGSFAAANADTWASELGVLSRREARSIIGWRPVPRGTSGGVSLLGLAASAAGGGFIALITLLGVLLLPGTHEFSLFTLLIIGAVISAVGLLGSLIDSLLGATVQALYLDPEGERTERSYGEKGAHILVKGLRWINNDGVNFLSILVAGILAFLAVAILVPSG